MSKPTAESHNNPRMTPENGASGTPHSDVSDSAGEVRSTDAKGAKTTTLFGALFGAAAAAPTWTAAGFLSLFGLAGGVAVSVAGWMSPILIGIAVIALGRSYYMLYVLKRGNLASAVITWMATLFVIVFWSWHWATG